MSRPTGSPCRVGVCDDVDSFRALLVLLFDLEPDLEVVGQAINGVEAIELVTDTHVDVLFLDVAMPIMDGLEALPRIREVAPHTKVVMLTGFGTSAIREQALRDGACRFVEKGRSPAALVTLIREIWP